jgi:hypothetical protein
MPGLLEAAKKMNEVNRQVRNLIAANVARLDAYTGGASVYRPRGANPPAYAYARKRVGACAATACAGKAVAEPVCALRIWHGFC